MQLPFPVGSYVYWMEHGTLQRKYTKQVFVRIISCLTFLGAFMSQWRHTAHTVLWASVQRKQFVVENLEDMFPLYYLYCDVFSCSIKFSTIQRNVCYFSYVAACGTSSNKDQQKIKNLPSSTAMSLKRKHKTSEIIRLAMIL